MTPTLLPLRDGSFFFDNSLLEAYQQCPRQAEYSTLRRRIRSDAKPGLNFGSAGHLVLDYRYKTFGPDMPPRGSAERQFLSNVQSRILQHHFSSHPNPEGDWRDLNWAAEIFLKHYNDRYETEPFSLLQRPTGGNLVEESFAIPFAAYNHRTHALRRIDTLPDLPDRNHMETYLVFCGKVDLPFLKDSSLFIGDHKCVSMLGDSALDTYRVSAQQIGYCWAFWRITGQMPTGFMVNLIRTRSLPQKPPRDGGYTRWWEENFYRLYEFLSPWHFPEWEQNTMETLGEFFYHQRKAHFPLRRIWCSGKYGRCAYYELCAGDPANRDLRLAQDAYTDNHWFALNPSDVPVKEIETTVKKEMGL